MNIKLDENLGPQAADILARAGHHVTTVQEEGLQGATDADIAAAILREADCLVTLDMDFANVVAFPPQDSNGILVLRHPRPTTREVNPLVSQLAAVLTDREPTGSLWIVEPGRLRIHEPS